MEVFGEELELGTILTLGIGGLFLVGFLYNYVQNAQEEAKIRKAQAEHDAEVARKKARFGAPETPDVNRVFTAKELATYNAVGKRIYLGCKGFVFDVTDSDFYGPDSSYPMLTGRDSSIALANMDLVNIFYFVCICLIYC